MGENKVYTAIGLMSGTSLDGIDAAFIKTDGENHIERLDFRSFPYPEEIKDAVRRCFGKRSHDSHVEEAERLLTQAHIKAVEAFGHEADLIGFHGQTITHEPEREFTWQIGDAERLANRTGINVVADMRQADIRNGGQGAPLLPLYHQALAQTLEKPLAVVNLGGVGNITWLGEGEDEIFAFDTGPGNALMDDFIKTRTGADYDEDGKLALGGHPDEEMLGLWLDRPYFHTAPPKSLDRNAWDISGIETLSDEDGAATLKEFTVRSVLKARDWMPHVTKRWLITGGGRHNKTLMGGLQAALHDVPVEPVEAAGWNGDAMEAEGFAYLAVRSVLGKPLTLPSTTGVKAPQKGGKIYNHK